MTLIRIYLILGVTTLAFIVLVKTLTPL